MVEAAGIEPASEGASAQASTCVARPFVVAARERVGLAILGCQAKSILSAGVFATLPASRPAVVALAA